MKMSGPITQELDRRLLTHKDYAVEMVESIIKDKDVDPYAEEMTRTWGHQASLTLLGYVSSFLSFLLSSVIYYSIWLTVVLLCGGWSI